nr:TIGR03885 family FMN-dependent LLM class oxidoreductase [uncultured Dyadobacter sp.]
MSKIRIGYHASHEQFKPSELINFVKLARHAGFSQILSSDHFFPWGQTQGESGFAWSWLGAAMQATDLTFGIVNAPGQRYHPAIIAQAVATLCEMFPQRFWIAVGSGQFLNEHITAERWPSKAERNQRLKECVDIMRALWAGESVTHAGMIDTYDAKLYTLPGYMPMVVGAALTEQTAEWVGGWADAMITTSRPQEQLKRMVEAFHRGGGEGKPIYLKVQLSYDTTMAMATEGAHQQWHNNIFHSSLLSDIRSPEGFDAAGAMVKPEDMFSAVRISDSTDQHVEWLAKDIEAGVSQLFLHNVNLNQQHFIEAFGANVLPQLAG